MSIFEKQAKKEAAKQKLRDQERQPTIGFIPSKANEKVGIKYNETDLKKPGTSYREIIEKRRLANLQGDGVDYMSLSGHEIAKTPPKEVLEVLETTLCNKRKSTKDDWTCDEEDSI